MHSLTLEDLLHSADSELAQEERRIVLVDDTFAEAFLANHIDTYLPSTSALLSLHDSHVSISRIVRVIEPTAVFCVMCGSSVQLGELKKLLLAAGLSQCKRVALVVSPSVYLFFPAMNVSEMVSLKFLPFKTSVSLIPLFLNPIVSSPTAKSSLHILSSGLCRDMHQPYLSSTSATTSGSISIADRLHQDDRFLLRLVTNELAGAVHSDLNLDPAGRIFTCGDISSLIGHNLETTLAKLTAQEKEDHNDKDAIRRLGCFSTLASRPKCSLVLVDRNEALSMPLSSAASSLGHRVLSTLPRRQNKAPSGRTFSAGDVCLVNATISALSEHPTTEHFSPAPMSGVRSLPSFVCPSIACQDYAPALVLLAEEAACRDICSDLVQETLRQGGETVPPSTKRRGLGAETLAHTQALMKCSTQLARHIPLLSTATAVIESMQRSSSKQFAQLCSWRCSFDVRFARELHVQSSGEGAVSAASALDRRVEAMRMLLQTSVESLAVPSTKGSKSVESSTSGPVDVEHSLMMLLQSTAVYGVAPHAMQDFLADLAHFMLTKSCAEELKTVCDLLSPKSGQAMRKRVMGARDGKSVDPEMSHVFLNLLVSRVSAAAHIAAGSLNTQFPPKADSCFLSQLVFDVCSSFVLGYKTPIPSIKYVDKPLANLARNGIGLLTKSLGKLAFGEAPHPADQTTLVVFIVGGISLLEAYRVQAVLDQFLPRLPSNFELVLASTSIVCPRDCLLNIFESIPE